MNSKASFDFQEKALKLKEAILIRHPSMPTLLRSIKDLLNSQPENVTLASEEEIATIVQGLEIQTNTFLADSVTKGKNTTGAKVVVQKLKNAGVDAF